MGKRKTELPHIGKRMIKSAIGVFLCFVIFLLRGRAGTPFYSALAVLWCIQPSEKDAVTNAFQRSVGTLIGAVYGLIFILLKIHVMSQEYGLFHYAVLSGMIIPIIYTTLLINKKNASYFSCVVYLSIVVNHLGDENPYSFVFNRSLDTMIGIVLGLLLTWLKGGNYDQAGECE